MKITFNMQDKDTDYKKSTGGSCKRSVQEEEMKKLKKNEQKKKKKNQGRSDRTLPNTGDTRGSSNVIYVLKIMDINVDDGKNLDSKIPLVGLNQISQAQLSLNSARRL